MKVSRAFTFTLTTLLCAGVIFSFSTSGLFAQRGADPTPQQFHSINSFLYTEATGLDEVRKAWEQTAMHDAMVNSGLHELLERVIIFAEQRDESGIVSKFKDGLEHISREGISMSIAIDPEAGMPIPYTALVLHDMRKWQSEIEEIISMGLAQADLEFTSEQINGVQVQRAVIPNSPGIEIGIIGMGKHVALVAGFDACRNTLMTLEQPNLSISSNAKWMAESAKSVSYAVETRFWLDFAPLKQIYGGIEFPISDQKNMSVNEVLQLAQIDSFDSFYYQQGYDGPAVRSEMRSNNPDPDANPEDFEFTFADLPALPEDLAFLHVCTHDIVGSYDGLISLANQILPLINDNDAEQATEVLNNLDEIVGFDIRNDLLSSFGRKAMVYSQHNTAVFTLGYTAALELKNPRQMELFLKLMMEKFYDLDDAGVTENWPIIPIESEKNGGKMIVFELGGYDDPYQYGAIQIVENWLVLSVFPQSIDAFDFALKGEIPTFKLDTQSQAVMAKMPEKITSFTYTDTKAMANSAYSMLITFAPFLQKAILDEIELGDEEMLPFYVEDLPPTAKVTKSLFPNLSVTTYDQQGTKGYSYQSLSGYPMILSASGNANTSVAGVGIGTALLLPAVQQAREAARRVNGQNQLKQIGLALHNHHAIYNQLPKGALNSNEPENGASWIVSILPLINEVGLSDQYKQLENPSWENTQFQEIANTQISILNHPSDSFTTDIDGYPQTNYVGMAGVGEDAPTLPTGHKRAGIFGYNRVTRFRDITDGTSNTIMIATVNANTGPWARGGKSTMRALTQKPYINGPDGLGMPGFGTDIMPTLLGDGSVRMISGNISDEVLENLSTYADGNVISWEDF